MMPGKLDMGAVFERIFKLYSKYFGLLVLIGFLVLVIPVFIVNVIVGNNIFGAIFAAAVGTAAGAYFQAVIIDLARDDESDSQFTVGSLFKTALPVLLPVIGAAI